MAEKGTPVVPVTRRQLVIAGVILATLIVVSIVLVRGSNNNDETDSTNNDTGTLSINDTGKTDEANDTNTEVENGEVSVENETSAEGDVSNTQAGDDAVASNQVGQTEVAQSVENWSATDYVSGDITGEVYTVKYGDTLWEIAEARYGSGYEWVRIYEANNVGLLPNGNPLIVPDQELNLP